MKPLSLILWVLTLLVGANAMIFFWRGADAVLHYDGLYRSLWVFKMLTYIGIAVLVGYIFLIRRSLSNQDGIKAISQIRNFCKIAFFAAFFNSLANAGMETYMEFGRQNLVGWEDAKRRFLFHALEQLFDGSLLVYIVVISVFLLTGFVGLAMRLKSENESFI